MSSEGIESARSDTRPGAWLRAIRIYVGASLGAHLVWEILQLPLYTIWETGTAGEQAFAIAHCTAGDLLIAMSCLVGALILVGRGEWPGGRFLRVAAVAIVLGVLYTAFSEWLNVSVRGSWAYSPSMPIIRPVTISIGLSPLMQWMVVPTLSFLALRRVVCGLTEAPQKL